jgi:branched-chain amino acid transport system substrate-binding protein
MHTSYDGHAVATETVGAKVGRDRDEGPEGRSALVTKTGFIKSAIAIVVAGAMVAACSSSPTPKAASTTKTPYTIDAVLGLTGALQPFGQAGVQSLKAAASVINKSGGILGHKIVIKSFDDQGTATAAASVVQGQLAGTPPSAFYAGTSSTEALAMVPATTSAKVFSFEQAAAATLDDPTKYPYNFSASANTVTGYEALGTYLQAKHITKVGILTSADAFGESENQNAVTEFNKLGIQYKTVTYADTEVNLTPQLEQLQAYNPGALYFVAFGPSAGYILENLHTLGWKVTTIGSPAVAATDLTTLVPAADLTGIEIEAFSVEKWVPPANRSAAFTAMINALKAQGPIAIPLYVYSFTYDGLQLVALAAKQANSLDAAKISNALEHLKQPAHPAYVSFPDEGYSPTEHSLTASPSDFVFLPAGHLVDGMLGAPAGTKP